LQKLSRLNSPSRANCGYGKNSRLNRHLTGRLLLEREGYPVNQRAVIDACAQTGTWIELNASPYRFDMDWRLWAYAKSQGVSGREGKGMTGKGIFEEALKSYATAKHAIAKSGKDGNGHDWQGHGRGSIKELCHCQACHCQVGEGGKGMTGKGMVEEALKSYATASNAIAKSGRMARA
jgi:hypothetical protein